MMRSYRTDKICPCCNQKRKQEGRSYCLECKREKNRQWEADNPEKARLCKAESKRRRRALERAG